MLGRRLRKRCSRCAVWLPAVTFSIAAVWEWCFSGVLVPAFAAWHRELEMRAPAQTALNFDPSVFQLSYGCAAAFTRLVELKKKCCLQLHTACTHSSSRALISASLLLVNASQDPRHRYFAVEQAAHHDSTTEASPARVHLGTSPSPRSREDNKTTSEHSKTTVDAPASRHVRTAARQGLGLRAQAREGFWRRPPQRHGHGPGWENCGARCGRSKG